MRLSRMNVLPAWVHRDWRHQAALRAPNFGIHGEAHRVRGAENLDTYRDPGRCPGLAPADGLTTDAAAALTVGATVVAHALMTLEYDFAAGSRHRNRYAAVHPLKTPEPLHVIGVRNLHLLTYVPPSRYSEDGEGEQRRHGTVPAVVLARGLRDGWVLAHPSMLVMP